MPPTLERLRASLLIVAISCFAAACTTTPAPIYVSAQPLPESHTITVAGTARLEIVPDEACIELTLVARDPSMPAAHARLREGQVALLAALARTSDLVVEGGTVRYAPEYVSDARGLSRINGHAASVQINVRTRDFAKIPDVVGAAADHGLDRVNVVFYSTEIVARKAEVRTHALEAARDKARAMAATLDVPLGDVVTIVEGDVRTNGTIEVANYLGRAAADAAPDLPAPPGAIPLSIDVTVVYRLKPSDSAS